MSEELIKKSLRNDTIFLHVLYNLPIRNLIKHACYIGGDLAFPLACCNCANKLYQNYKRTLLTNSKTTQQRISLLLEDIDLLTTFEDNHFLQMLLQNIEAKKWSAVVFKPVAVRTATVHQRKRPSSTLMLKTDLDDDYQDVSVDGSFYNDDPAVPTPVVPMALS
jgi:hypothetical protein